MNRYFAVSIRSDCGKRVIFRVVHQDDLGALLDVWLAPGHGTDNWRVNAITRAA